MPGMDYEEKKAQLAAGDSLFLYSDGLLEAHNRQKEMYGSPRLRSHLGEHRGGVGMVHHALQGLEKFTGPDWEQEDDVTCVVLERHHK
jgi:serine phosphatase RsbU (regulator of sigma subunit)